MVRIVIIGGGVMGSSLACWLTRDAQRMPEVIVVERDPTYARASSALSASSIRQQFSTPVNIEISRFGVEFLRRVGDYLSVDGETPAIGLVEGGYLFLATEAGLRVLERNHEVQRAHGADVVLLGHEALGERFPWMNLAGIEAGSLGLSGEGWFDGWALLQAFRRRAIAQGARYLRCEAVAAEREGRRARAVRLEDGTRLEADLFVNAAGPWASQVASFFEVGIPVEARRRCVFAFTCPQPPHPCPLVVDPSGLWFRPEGRGFICGLPPRPEEDLADLPLEVDHEMFEERIWPILADRVPAFERLRVTGSWAGYYAFNTFDQNALLGFHPELDNLLFMNGFSGHGLQQAAAVGRGIAELILEGRYRSIDLAPLDIARVSRGEPLRERNVV